jgi:hypothetical protein
MDSGTPITFESIHGQQKVETTDSPDVVVTTLRAAVDFVMGLDNRERAAAACGGRESAPVPAPQEWYIHAWKCDSGDEPIIVPGSKIVSDGTAEALGWCGESQYQDSRVMVMREEQRRRMLWKAVAQAPLHGIDSF